MLTVGAADDRALGDRPRPRRPIILLASGTTGEGVPELLAAIDRRAHERVVDGQVTSARLARAKALVESILRVRMDRALWDGPRRSRTEATVAALARRELDPSSAADQLTASLGDDPQPGG